MGTIVSANKILLTQVLGLQGFSGVLGWFEGSGFKGLSVSGIKGLGGLRV